MPALVYFLLGNSVCVCVCASLSVLVRLSVGRSVCLCACLSLRCNFFSVYGWLYIYIMAMLYICQSVLMLVSLSLSLSLSPLSPDTKHDISAMTTFFHSRSYSRLCTWWTFVVRRLLVAQPRLSSRARLCLFQGVRPRRPSTLSLVAAVPSSLHLLGH